MQASRNRSAGAKKLPGSARKQPRALETRRLLLDAARQVFADKGFENTRLEDIADAAGKSRGAFYANFRDKEDVFFAIFEDDFERDRELISRRVAERSGTHDRITTLARVLNEIVNDVPRMRLAIDFKQYAVRHPSKQKRFAALQDEMCDRCAEADLENVLPQFGHDGRHKRAQSAQIRAIIDGVALNRMFDCESLSEADSLKLIEAVLRVVFAKPEE